MGDEHTAVLLAAGASTRLGQPKQLLTRHGVPLVRVMALALAATRPRRLVVVLGAHADEIDAAIGDVAHDAVINPDFADGLSTSLRCAARVLAALQNRVLIAACDQPALQARHLEMLLEASAASLARCAATMHGSRLGVPAVMPDRLFQRSHALVGDRGFGTLLSGMKNVAQLDFAELTLDIDTQIDVEHARASGWLDAAG